MYLISTYRLLSITPDISTENEKQLSNIEITENIQIPGAIKELFLLKNVEMLLDDLYGDNHPINVKEWGKTYKKWYGGPSRNFLKDGLIHLATENQGVCNWASPLYAGDDPKVLVEVDTAPKEVWQEFSPSFSKFVYCLAFDHFGWEDSENCYYETYDSLNSKAIVTLCSRFNNVPSTFHWPANTIYRFSREDIKIVIWNGSQQADWAVICNSPAKLATIKSELEQLWFWTNE